MAERALFTLLPAQTPPLRAGHLSDFPQTLNQGGEDASAHEETNQEIDSHFPLKLSVL